MFLTEIYFIIIFSFAFHGLHNKLKLNYYEDFCLNVAEVVTVPKFRSNF